MMRQSMTRARSPLKPKSDPNGPHQGMRLYAIRGHISASVASSKPGQEKASKNSFSDR